MEHGGRVVQARRMFPGAPEPFMDLSTGINPVPYPFDPLPLDLFTRLPEPEEVLDLQRVAARAYGVADPAMVVAAPGSQMLIQLLPRLRPLPGVAVLGPTYAEHAAAWAAAGSIVSQVAEFAQLGAVPGAVLCNPNNPDGRRTPVPALLALAERLAAHGGLLVVDEAFADLEGSGRSVAPLLPRPGLVVLRSFGKAYGLAGVRLGFALASPELAGAIRDALGPWAVSGPALRIARQALADRAWAAASAERLRREAACLDGVLAGSGLRVLGGTSLFRLVEVPDAQAVFTRLGRAGILVRRFAGDPHRLRFGLPRDAEQLSRLARTLAGNAGATA